MRDVLVSVRMVLGDVWERETLSVCVCLMVVALCYQLLLMVVCGDVWLLVC